MASLQEALRKVGIEPRKRGLESEKSSRRFDGSSPHNKKAVVSNTK
jgi:hypothetical protein